MPFREIREHALARNLEKLCCAECNFLNPEHFMWFTFFAEH